MMLAGANDRAELAAAVDLGSNSFHMIVGRLEGGQLHIVDKLRERVLFAAGLDEERCLGAEAFVRALDCLGRFGQRIAGMPLDRVRVVGTNTLRVARNAREFMDRAEAVLGGYPVEIVSGREEARLIYLGVAQTTPSEGGRRLVVDIGGGSTEVIIGEGFDVIEADSLYMGCVAYSERFFSAGLTAQAFREAQLAAELELQSIARRYWRIGWSRTLGSSGTVHAVHDIVLASGWGDGITAKNLKKLRKALTAAGSVEALELPGLAPDRKPVIAGGVAILEALFDELRLEQMTPAPGALREGVLYDLVGRLGKEDVRDRTIRWFQEHYHVDVEQAARVEETALSLLYDASPAWGLDPDWASRQLRRASRLHEMGLVINHTGYHKHSAYLARHSHMAGFAKHEQQILATILVNHRRKLRGALYDELDPDIVPDVIKLSVLFRLAVRLNRGRDPEVPRCVLKAKKDRLKLVFPEGWLQERPLTRAALEQEAEYLAAIGFQLQLRSGQLAS